MDKQVGEIELSEFFLEVSPQLNVPLSSQTNLGIRLGPLVAIAREVIRVDVFLSHDL